MQEWMEQRDSEFDSLKEIKMYFENTKYFEFLCKYLNLLVSGKERTKLDKEVNMKIKELEEISNKPKYFEKIKKLKMKLLNETKKIDILLSSKTALQKEFEKKNLKLEDSQKIPSVLTYERLLKKRRKEILNQISDLTKKVNPINYINYKEELEKFIENSSSSQDNKEDIIIDLQKEFIKGIKEEILDTDDGELLKSYCYKLRYYRFLYVSKEKQVKDIKELNLLLEDTLRALITKLCKLDLLRKIVSDVELNFKIIFEMLDTKIIDLKELKFEIEIKEGKILIKTYEKDTYEKSFEIEQNIEKKDILVKLDKKLKLFI